MWCIHVSPSGSEQNYDTFIGGENNQHGQYTSMTALLVGFDSAWTPNNSGAIVGVLRSDDGTVQDLGPPQTVNFAETEHTILGWQVQHEPAKTIVLLDQPTIVKNIAGQRPLENLVSSSGEMD